MRVQKVILAMVTGAALAGSGFAASTDSVVFRDVDEATVLASGSGQRTMVGARIRLIEVDIPALVARLAQAPLEGSPGAAADAPRLDVPLPDGRMAGFRMVEVRIMSEQLARRYPEIRTYRGQGLDDPTATLNCDLTPAGFHGMILGADGTVLINPFLRGSSRWVASAFKRDLERNPGGEPFICQVKDVDDHASPGADGGTAAGEGGSAVGQVPLTASGATLRTYRLALAATGEYTTTVCSPNPPAVPCALAAMVTSMNRVDGIYEREVAIRMVLIGNTDQVIYTDGATDPYSNGNGSAMLGQNQTNLDAVIGTANYDIGHVFSTGGGGIAMLSGPCNGSIKAQGVTGSSNPTGDGFDVDYVAHEMGHQFGARHTFNGTTSNCGGGNRSASAAYEPGSGSTIMAYAGICGAENLQPHSDDYFHVKSFDEIVAFSTGAGNSCAVSSATGNGAPTVDAGSSHTVPKQTPFTLTGSGTDPQGDALTFCWEEYDLGAQAPPNDDAAAARPIFRSFLATVSGSRTLPRLADILSGTPTFGESMSQRTRTMTFRLTARDNRLGGGGVNYAATTVNVNAGAGPFVVTQPTAGASWPGLSQQTVQWNVASTNLSPVNCANVAISLSTDGGFTFPTTLLAATANDGSEAVTVPNTATMAARIRVGCADNIFFDISNPNFTITTSISWNLTVLPAGTGSGVVTSTPAGIACPSTCQAGFPDGQSVVLHAVADAGSAFTGWSGAGCTGTGDCTVAMTQARTVTATFDPCVAPGAFALSAPADAATVTATPVTLQWSASAGATAYDVYFGIGSPVLVATVAGTSAQVGVTGGTTYQWRIVARNACSSLGAPPSGTWSFTVPFPALAAERLVSVDQHAVTGSVSDLNAVFEPGESVVVAPSWSNAGGVPVVVTSVASAFTGPVGPTYTLDDAAAAYGTVQPAATADCWAGGGDCLRLAVSAPTMRPVLHWDSSLTETLSTGATKTWTLHIGDSFTDVARGHWAYRFVETILHNGITSGCGAALYCPDTSLTRAEMAVLLLMAKHGPAWTPPLSTGLVFTDVPIDHWAGDFIETLAAEGITSGCGTGLYCPENPITRAEIAVFLLVAKHGSAWTPPLSTGLVFTDVPIDHWAGDFIEELAAEGITSGCGGGLYCPDSPVTRAEMAVFLTATFNLKLY